MFIKSSRKKLTALLIAGLMLLSLLPGALAAQIDSLPMTLTCTSATVGVACSVQAYIPSASGGQVVFYAEGLPIGSASVLPNGFASIQWTPKAASSTIYAEYFDESDVQQFSASYYVQAQSQNNTTNTTEGGTGNTGALDTLPDGNGNNIPPVSQNQSETQSTPNQTKPQSSTQTDQLPYVEEDAEDEVLSNLIDALLPQEEQNKTNNINNATTVNGTGDSINGSDDEDDDGTSGDDEDDDGVSGDDEDDDGTSGDDEDDDGVSGDDEDDDGVSGDDEDDDGVSGDDEDNDGVSGDDEDNDGISGDGISGDGISGDGISGDGVSGDDEDDDGVSGDDEDDDGISGDDEDGDGISGDDEDGDGISGDDEDGDGDAGIVGFSGLDVSGIMAINDLFSANTTFGVTASTISLSNPGTVDLASTKTVTLNATVMGPLLSSPTPTGKVLFYNSGTLLATVSLGASGTASLLYAPSAAGSYTIDAVYTGDNNYAATANSTTFNVISTAYQAKIQMYEGMTNNATTIIATVVGPLLSATDTVTLKRDGVVLETKYINTTTGNVSFITSTVPNGIHTYTVEYTAAGGATATASVTVFSRNGVYSTFNNPNQSWGNSWDKPSGWNSWNGWNNWNRWSDWNDWNNWDNWNQKSSQIDIYATAAVSGTTVTITATLTPNSWSGVNQRYNYPVDWYGNQYGRYNSWYPGSYQSNAYSVAPDGSSYSRTYTPTSWNSSYWGTAPQGTVSFYRGNTLLGTAPVYDGIAQFPWTKAPSGTHTIQVIYSGDRNYASASTSVTAQVKSATVKPSSTKTTTPTTTTTTTTGTSGSVSSRSVAATPAPAQTTVFLRNSQVITQETYDLQKMEQISGDIMLETTKVLDIYKYGIPLMEMRNLAKGAQGRLLLATSSFAFAVPYALANNMTDLNGYLLRYGLSESQVEIRVDIEPINNAALVSAYQKANPDSLGTPTFYRIDIGLNDINGRKLDFNPGKLGAPAYMVITALDFTTAQRYDEQTGAFYPAEVDLESELPILTVEQSGIYVLTKDVSTQSVF